MLVISKNIIIGRILAFFFILLALAYYYTFVVDRHLDAELFFKLATNQHDHDVYLFNIDLVKNGSSLFELANDKGIASIYIFLSNILPFLTTPDMELMSFAFNCFILILNYYIYGKLVDKLQLGLFGRLSFFFNLSLLYFAQLINKDMLTILIFLTVAYAGMRGRHWPLVLLLPFSAYIRIQLVLFILFFIFLSSAKKIGLRFIIVYTFSSIMAAIISVYFPIIGDESLGNGFNAFLIKLNKEYIIGYLIFNPVRLLQYIYDVYRSFIFISEDGSIDVAKILRLPQLALLATLTIYFFRIIKYWHIYSKTDANPLVVTILAYACTWLMNPTINARYVMLITPILVLLGLYAKNTHQRKIHHYV